MSNAFDTATDANAGPPLPVGKGDSPSPATGGPPKSFDDLTYDKVNAADLSLTKQKIGAEAGMESQRKRSDDAYAQRQERLIAAEGATMDDIKPWNAEKELNDRKTNLWEQFGSPGFVIAMIASTFSGTPMNSALNAGAAAMNAINEGDMDRYHKAFDAWKENSNLTLKRLDLEEHQFGQIENLRTKNMESWRASAASLAARFNDKRLQIMLENGMDQQAMEAIDARAKAKVELAGATQLLIQNNVRMGLLNNDPDYNSGDPKRMIAAIHRIDDAMRNDDPTKLTPDQYFQWKWHQENPEGTSAQYAKAFSEFKRNERAGTGGDPFALQQQIAASDAGAPSDESAGDAITRQNKIRADFYRAKNPIGAERNEIIRDKNQITQEENQIKNDLSSRRITRQEAKDKEDSLHKRNQDAIAEGRLEGQLNAQQEKVRHDNALETIAEQRIDVSREAEEGRNKRAELSSATRQEINKLSLDARKEIEAAREQVKAIEIDHQDRRTGAQIEGSFERLQISDKTRREIAGMNNDARKELQEYLEGGRNKRAGGNPAVPGVLDQWTEARNGQPPTPEMEAIIRSAYNTKGSVGGARIAQVGTALAEIKERLDKGEQLNGDEQEKILRAAVQQAPTGMTLDKESADLIADQYLAGDRMAAAGFARSAQNMSMIRKAINEKAKEQGLSGAEIAMKIAEFHGIVSAETATGRREATIGMFANETKRIIEVAKRASKDVPRGEFIPFNRAMLAFEKNTGDPKVVALGAALNAVINTYAKAINGGQQGTVSDKDHAREILELAYSDNQMDAVYNILEQELQAAIDAPGDVKQSLRDLQSGKVKPAPNDPNVIRYDSEGNRIH